MRRWRLTCHWNGRFELAPNAPLFCLLALCACSVRAHFSLTFPESRYPPFDFLDTQRTIGPCGVPKSARSTRVLAKKIDNFEISDFDYILNYANIVHTAIVLSFSPGPVTSFQTGKAYTLSWRMAMEHKVIGAGFLSIVDLTKSTLFL